MNTTQPFQIGQKVMASPSLIARYGEWAKVELWVCGIRYSNGGFNISVSERWPPASLGCITDGWDEYDLIAASSTTNETVPKEMPPLLPHGSHHSFSNAMIGTGPKVRIARAEHKYNMLRESMLADRRVADLVQSGIITPAEGQLTKTRNIELAWESYAALQALIAEQRQSEAEAAPCST